VGGWARKPANSFVWAVTVVWDRFVWKAERRDCSVGHLVGWEGRRPAALQFTAKHRCSVCSSRSCATRKHDDRKGREEVADHDHREGRPMSFAI
jgi:hypothetical protein